MKRSTLIAIVIAVLAVVGIVLWNAESSSPLSLHKPVRAANDHSPAAPDMAVGKSCNAMCGATPIAITCAVGETPACDCNATPRVQCLRTGTN